MPRKLTTDFVKIATSGPTIDGRNIPAQDIVDMAESYDLEEYTANITYEHIRYFGNLGKVVEVKAENDGKGRMSLYGKLAPTDDLVYLNSRGQKLFTSIEIQPDFAGTGKAYLAGLAVTDSPASLGTSELQFSRAQKPDNFFTKPIELNTLALEDSQGILSRLLNSFGREEPSQPKPKSSDAMDEKQFNSLKEGLEGLQQKIGDLESKFSQGGQGGDGADGGEAGADDKAPVSKEEFKALMDKVDALGKQIGEGGDGGEGEGEGEGEGANQTEFAKLSKQLNDLTEKFSQALNTGKPGTTVPPGEGEGGTARVL